MTRHRLLAIPVLVLSIVLLAFGCKLDGGDACDSFLRAPCATL